MKKPKGLIPEPDMPRSNFFPSEMISFFNLPFTPRFGILNMGPLMPGKQAKHQLWVMTVASSFHFLDDKQLIDLF
jgi:hypothetical protein